MLNKYGRSIDWLGIRGPYKLDLLKAETSCVLRRDCRNIACSEILLRCEWLNSAQENESKYKTAIDIGSTEYDLDERVLDGLAWPESVLTH